MIGSASIAGLRGLIEPRNVLFVSPLAATHGVVDVADQVVRVTITSADAGVLKMPDVEEAAGRIYAISVAATGGGGGDCDVVESDDSTDIVGDALTAVADHVLLYSDGFLWHVLCDVTT